ncbi:MAG: response regulator [Rhizomicrobium sp.]
MSRQLQTILVVEDEPWIRLALADHLEGCGFVVLEAASVATAITLIEAHPLIELVFTDVRFPDDDEGGLALARWVAQHRPGIPLMLASGDLSRGNGVEDLCRVQGFTTLPKPYIHAEVSARIRALLGSKSQPPAA